MDGLSTALLAAAPQLGIAGVLLALLVYVLRHASADRLDYRTALAEAQTRHTTELRRLTATHDAEVAELRTGLTELRARVDALTAALDAERRRRWQAEDAAAELRRHGRPGRGHDDREDRP